MNRIFTLLVLAVFISVPVSAQETNTNSPAKIISAGAAKHFVGQTNTVMGKVAQATIREKIVYLNLEKPYPDTPFTGVIFASRTNQFDNLEKLQGKTVMITGKITEYRDQPQIVIENKAQLQVVEESPGEPPPNDGQNKARPDQ